jgi:hypothetical protein
MDVPAETTNVTCVGSRPGCFPTIQAAVNAASPGGKVEIPRGSFAGNITITKSVSLVGAGAGLTTIRGGGPVLTIGSATTSQTVMIAALTVTGGVARTGSQSRCGPDVATCGPFYTTATALGGGIETSGGATVTVLNSRITGNRAMPTRSVPSSEAVCPGNVPCRASFGDAAGIDDWGTMTLIGTTVSNNHAAGDQSDGGGIVDEQGASLTLRGSTVSGNTASALPPAGRFAAGGGIFVDDGALTVINSHIDDNGVSIANSIRAPYPEQSGSNDDEQAYSGGVYIAAGSVTIVHSTLDGNAVTVDTPLGQTVGADAAMCACGDDQPLSIASSAVDDNRLSEKALSGPTNGPNGGILEADPNTTITNTQITGNTITVATPSGDAFAIGALSVLFAGTVTPTIDNTTISDNVAEAIAPNGTATVQGAGLLNDGPLLLEDVHITDNYAVATGKKGSAEGAGIWNGHLFGGPTSPLTLRGTHVTGNKLRGSPSLTLQGAGIYTPDFRTTLYSSVVADNTPDECYGIKC